MLLPVNRPEACAFPGIDGMSVAKVYRRRNASAVANLGPGARDSVAGAAAHGSGASEGRAHWGEPGAPAGERWSSSLGHGFVFYKWIVPLFPFSD